jgi:hypothetical protein
MMAVMSCGRGELERRYAVSFARCSARLDFDQMEALNTHLVKKLHPPSAGGNAP